MLLTKSNKFNKINKVYSTNKYYTKIHSQEESDFLN